MISCIKVIDQSIRSEGFTVNFGNTIVHDQTIKRSMKNPRALEKNRNQSDFQSIAKI